MAISIPATNWNIFDHMNSATNQNTDATIMSGTGTTPTDITIGDTDATVNQFQASGTPPATGYGGKWASALNVDMSAAGAHLFAWFQSLDLMDTEANNGLILRIGHDTGGNNTNYKQWTVGGSDTRRYVINSFIRLAVDLAATADASAGTVTLNSVDGYWVGGQYTTLSGQKTTHIDNFMLMSGPILVQGGVTGDRGQSSEISADDLTDGRGVFKDIGGVYYLCAGMQFGNTAAVASYFEDVGETWLFEDQNVAVDWYEVSFVGGTAVNLASFGTLIGTGIAAVGVGGNNFIANGQPFLITALESDITVNLYGCNFLNSATAGGDCRFEQANCNVISNLFSSCGPIQIRNNAKFRKNTVSDSTALATEGALDLGAVGPGTDEIRDNTIQNNLRGVRVTPPAGVSVISYNMPGTKYANNTFDVLNDGPATTLDSYGTGNQDATHVLNDNEYQVGQTFVGNGSVASRAKFLLSKSGTPTGNIVAEIFAVSGLLTKKPADASEAVAISEPVDVSGLTGTLTLTDFEFRDEQLLTAFTDYGIGLRYTDGTATNTVNIGTDGSVPSHSGNKYNNFSTAEDIWEVDSSQDVIFEMYTGGVAKILVSEGGDIPTVETLNGATIIENPVAISIQVNDPDGNPVEGAKIKLEDEDIPWNPFNEIGNSVAEGTTDATGLFENLTFNYVGDINVRLKVRLKGYLPFRTSGVLGNAGYQQNVRFAPDDIVDLP